MSVSIYITDVDSHDDLKSETSVTERENKSFLTFGIFMICLAATVTLSCYVKEDLRRLNYKAGDSQINTEMTDIEDSQSARKSKKVESSSVNN